VTRLPTATPRKVVAALKRAGFIEHHQKGSHLYLWHPSQKRMTTVPIHPGDLHRGVLRSILLQTGLSEQQFHDLL
jgi:predicted RNA binding protein YcfA (HicA-like mRNA interferase family)